VDGSNTIERFPVELLPNRSSRKERKERCTRATPRDCDPHAPHRSTRATVRLHNRQWHGQRSTLQTGVKDFLNGHPVGVAIASYSTGVSAMQAICGSSGASLGLWTVRGEEIEGRVVSSRYVHTWWTPKDGILTRMGLEVHRNTWELDENGSGPGRGPCFVPLGPPAGTERGRSRASGARTPAAGGKQAPEGPRLTETGKKNPRT
jgi:hypothetical protein